MFPWYLILLFGNSVALVTERVPTWSQRWLDQMKMVNFRPWGTSAVAALSLSEHASAFNAPSNIPTWCGKPYMSRYEHTCNCSYDTLTISSSSSFDPGGQFEFPTPQSSPLLYLTVQPRYTIFLESDTSGSFIVDATTSYVFGDYS